MAAARILNMSDAKRKLVGRDNDVADHRWADDAGRWNEQRYRTLFDLGPVAVYSCDASGVIQEFNRRAVELWGSEPAAGDTDKRFCGSFKLFRPGRPLHAARASVPWPRWSPARLPRRATQKWSSSGPIARGLPSS